MSLVQKEKVQEHFDSIAHEYDRWKEKNWYYYENIKAFVNRIVRSSSRVLEIGCGTGEILASTKPSFGVGIDISPKMVELAQTKFPEYTFIASSIENLDLNEKFDYIILVDVVDHVYDVHDVFDALKKFCHPQTRIVLTTINPWWEPLLGIMEKVKAKMPEGPHNFIEQRYLKNIAESLNYAMEYSGYLLMLPKNIPVLSYLFNTIGVRLWLLNKFSSVQYIVFRLRSDVEADLNYGCSVVVPCYNEEDNIAEVIGRIPDMGKQTEILVVNDGSRDQTAQKVAELAQKDPRVKLIDYESNHGKGYAVQKGFMEATQEIVMICDADMSVSPEELPRFFDPLNHAQCQFVNGTRMVYPMEHQAMRMLNLFGNKIFSWIMTFITQQYLSDTLCGTKALYKKDFERLNFGLDKWGDFDLLFGAARLGAKILEVPVHYKARRGGESKMKTFRHGLHLLRACWKGFGALVFVRLPRRKAG